MNKAYTDPATRLFLEFQINREALLEFEFEKNCAPLDISTNTWELFIKRYPGDRKSVISLTFGNGLSIPIYEESIIEAYFTPDQTNIQEGEYYWELMRTDQKLTFLCGIARFTYNPKDTEE